MCRSKELGGRRCPQHTDPTKRSAYNARRRELYALRKAILKVSPADARRQLLLSPDEPRLYTNEVHAAAFIKEAHEYYELMMEQTKTKLGSKDLPSLGEDFEYTDEPDELLALHKYSSDGYRTIREYLNGNLAATAPWLDESKLEAEVQGLDSALERAPEVEPRLLYRGIRITSDISKDEVSGWLAENFPVGGVVSQANYVSTSVHPQIAANFSDGVWSDDGKKSIVMEIVSSNGAPLGHEISANPGESEVLLPRNSRFKVVAVHENSLFHVNDPKASYDNDLYSNVTLIQVVDVTNEAE
jgi:hypothetical protein